MASADAGPRRLAISDGWFGESAAPHQHLALAAFRAVELRRDFVRSTNTGVSAIIDAVGRVTLEGPLYGLPVDQPKDQPTLLMGEVALLEVRAFRDWDYFKV
jgi:hypothetical protein